MHCEPVVACCSHVVEQDSLEVAVGAQLRGGCHYPSVVFDYMDPLPTMTDSLFAPGQEVLCKRYHTGELVEATILGPAKSAPKLGERVQLFTMKRDRKKCLGGRYGVS